MLIGLDLPVRHSDSERGLADPAWSYERDQTLVWQSPRERADDIAATDHPPENARQVVLALCRGNGLRRSLSGTLCDRDRGYKTVPAPGNVNQIPIAAAQRSAECRDVDFEVALLDKGAGPDAGHEVVLADEFAGMLHERDQNIERPAAETDRIVAFKHQAL